MRTVLSLLHTIQTSGSCCIIIIMALPETRINVISKLKIQESNNTHVVAVALTPLTTHLQTRAELVRSVRGQEQRLIAI